MRWLKVAVALAALAVVARVADARVPAFVRQTGLTCNQCHMSVTPAPDFTFTGMKFRLNGFRTPWVAEKIEAGQEGALNGQRLVLTLGAFNSMHGRSILIQQASGPSDPALAAPAMGAPNSDIFGTLAMHFAGPIGDHIGIWNELYIYGGGGPGGNTHGYIGLNHYLYSLTTNSGGNILGWQVAGYSEGSHNFLGVVGNAAPNNQLRFGTNLSGSHGPYFLTDIYGFLGDRFAILMGVEPGDGDNLDWKRFNYRFQVGYFLMNTDAQWLILNYQLKAGNDLIPIVSSLKVLNDGQRTIYTADAVQGVSAYRGGASYTSAQTGDGKRMIFNVSGGFTDKGPSSVTWNLGQSIESETYIDGAGSKMSAWGLAARYYYNRTYGINLAFAGYEKYNFTDAAGTVHNIPQDVTMTDLTLIYRFAMNFNFYVAYAPSQALVLDQNWRNGKSWSLDIQYLW